MNCKNYRIRSRKGLRYCYCIKYKKEVPLFCKCEKIEYKEIKPIKKRTSKLNKKEKERFSLFSADESKCYFCSSNYHLTWHEIFGGRNRLNSMKYGLCLRMCMSCHMKYQNDKDFNNLWHKKGQAIFNKTYPDLDFIKIFRRY